MLPLTQAPSQRPPPTHTPMCMCESGVFSSPPGPAPSYGHGRGLLGAQDPVLPASLRTARPVFPFQLCGQPLVPRSRDGALSVPIVFIKTHKDSRSHRVSAESGQERPALRMELLATCQTSLLRSSQPILCPPPPAGGQAAGIYSDRSSRLWVFRDTIEQVKMPSNVQLLLGFGHFSCSSWGCCQPLVNLWSSAQVGSDNRGRCPPGVYRKARFQRPFLLHIQEAIHQLHLPTRFDCKFAHQQSEVQLLPDGRLSGPQTPPAPGSVPRASEEGRWAAPGPGPCTWQAAGLVSASQAQCSSQEARPREAVPPEQRPRVLTRLLGLLFRAPTGGD